jgi:SMC domain protein
MSEKRDAQREVTRIALSGIAGFGFALAGSGAIREHGVIDRPTEDVDLFTTTRDPVEFVRAIERVSKDLRERGYEVGEVRRATWFARLRVRAADGTRLENVESLDFSWTDEGRVMLALDEGRGRRTTARLMSDGILRFSAVTTALMTASTSLDIGGSGPASPAFDAPAPGVVLAIEEIENGLHPSHAARLLDLVESVSRQPGVSVLLTTHSPALLDAIDGKAIRDVLVCYGGRVSPLIDMPGYATAMAGGGLGRVVSQGGLVSAGTQGADDYSGFLHLIGAES